MHRRAIIPVLAALAIAALGFVAGCGGDNDSAEKAKPTTPGGKTTEQRAQERERGRGGPQTRRKQGRARRKRSLLARAAAGDKKAERALEAREREEDRKFDRQFRETPFEKLLDKLPIREPPLYVEQYITTDGSHKIYTAVSKKRFLCEMTPRQRRAAVAAFYRPANRVFRAGGIRDFVLVVTPLAETTEKLPALAVARNGSVSLTRRGRESGRC